MPQLNETQERYKLRTILQMRSLQQGRRFKLSSGAETDVYIDSKLTTFIPEAMPLIADAFISKFHECGWTPQAVGGRTIGADPIAYAIAFRSLTRNPPIRAFTVRKEPKKHGMERFIEGLDESECRGLSVVILDDVCTQGCSTGDAIEKARKAGVIVLGAVCLVDREQGATEFLEKNYQCRLESIYKLSEIVTHDGSHATPIPVGAHS
jgi:orotate phosphoribosyltransferase